jgi:hypothetical protein
MFLFFCKHSPMLFLFFSCLVYAVFGFAFVMPFKKYFDKSKRCRCIIDFSKKIRKIFKVEKENKKKIKQEKETDY